MFLIWPISTELLFNKLQKSQVDITQLNENEKSRFESLTHTGWYFMGTFDQQGTNISNPEALIRDSKNYFNTSGKLQQVLFNGAILEGTWNFSSSMDSLKIVSTAENVTLKINELTNYSFSLELGNTRLVFKPYKFNILTYIESFF